MKKKINKATKRLKEKSSKSFQVITNTYTHGKMTYFGFFVYKNEKQRDKIFEELLKEDHQGHLSRQYEDRHFNRFFKDIDYDDIEKKSILIILYVGEEKEYLDKIKKELQKTFEKNLFSIPYKDTDIYLKDIYL